jgi:cyclopropane-fatty-acyl-phospholipid synthase
MNQGPKEITGERPDPQGSGRAASAAASGTLQLLETLLPAERHFDIRLWDGSVLPASAGPARATLVLNEPDTLARMLQPPLDVSAGEAYLRGDFDIEGDISAILEALDDLTVRRSPAQWLALARQLSAQAGSPLGALAAARLKGRRHSRKRDRQAIAHHYDVSNEFYQLWLDELMVYSCAYFPTGTETLAQAQEAKLDLICRKLHLHEGDRLLDIGCGWGGLVIHAARNYGVTAQGVTLSEQQVTEARRRVQEAGLAGRVKVDLLDYRDLTGTCDKSTSVGMAEHVGSEKLPGYFALARERLRPGGLMLNHAISRGPCRQEGNEGLVSGEFVQRHVFPDGEILPLWQQLQAAESAGFEVRDVEDLREHYARTLSCWVDNLESRRDAAASEVGAERARLWRLYMSTAGYYFRRGYLAVHQSLLARPDENGRVPLPPARDSGRSVSRAAGTPAG